MTPHKFFIGRAIGTIAVLAIVGIIGFYSLNNRIYEEKQPDASSDYKSAEYMIEGQRVTLGDSTKYFGNELMTDLDGDGVDDVVFIITQENGGSGTFYYVVAALNTPRGYVGSEAILLGDRIAPQTIEKGTGKIIVVNYADRATGEPFTTPPSVGKSLRLIFDSQIMQFGEVVNNFEGEADPSRMTLGMKEWVWISALYNDGREILPKKPGVFTLTFSNDGRFSAKTDCNSMSGSYEASEGTITFGQIAMTKMYCEGSQESDFASLLQNASGYLFTSKGELVLDLKFDSGTVTFR